MVAIIDCNSFYASCERLFRPDLKDKPIVVLSNNDGCIIARNDKAKELGAIMGEPFFKAKAKLVENGIVFFSSNYALYGDISHRVMQTLQQINPEIEVYSIDEAFLDLSSLQINNYTQYALAIKERVYRHTGIPVSVGIAPTKVLAKVANRLAKKNKEETKGVLAIETKEEIEKALQKTNVADIWGIGKKKAIKLKQQFGVETAYDFYEKITEPIARKFFGGVVGVRLCREIKGEQSIFVKQGSIEKKHIATTRSFGRPITKLSELKEAIAVYAERALQKLEEQQTACKSIGVFLRTDPHNKQKGYYSNTKFTTLSFATQNPLEVVQHAIRILEDIYLPNYEYLKAGVFLSGFESVKDHQLFVFEDQHDTIQTESKHQKIAQLLAKSQLKYGEKKITVASSGEKHQWQMRSNYKSPEYTTNWNDLPIVKKAN